MLLVGGAVDEEVHGARGEPELRCDLLLDVLSRQQQRFSQDDDLATQLAATDPAQPPELPAGTTITDLAAWTAISRILLNLDEAITKQ